MKRYALMFVLLSASMVGCGISDAHSAKPFVNPLAEIKANLAFACVHEQIPAPSAETDELFQYARWLQKNNLLKQDKAVDLEIERLYRIAAENGHYKANINL